MELSTKEIEGKTKNWIEEVKQFKEDQLKVISENYESMLNKTREELEDAQLNNERLNYKLSEETQLKENFKDKFEESMKDVDRYKEISKNKDVIIKTQKENLAIMESSIKDLKNIKEERIHKDQLETIRIADSDYLLLKDYQKALMDGVARDLVCS